MSIDTVRAKAIALLNAGALTTPAFERLAEEYGKCKAVGLGTHTEPQNKRRPPMAKKVETKVARKVLKGVNGQAVRQSGFGRGAASNWDAFGTPVKTKGFKLEDGVYQVKNGELRRMADTNGTGTVCVVYRVGAKAKDEAPAKAKAKKVEKKAKEEPMLKGKKVEKKIEKKGKQADKHESKHAKKHEEKKADKKAKHAKK